MAHTIYPLAQKKISQKHGAQDGQTVDPISVWLDNLAVHLFNAGVGLDSLQGPLWLSGLGNYVTSLYCTPCLGLSAWRHATGEYRHHNHYQKNYPGLIYNIKKRTSSKG